MAGSRAFQAITSDMDLRCVFTLAVVFTLVGCSGPASPPPTPKVTTIQVTPDGQTIKPGASIKLSALVKDQFGKEMTADLTWNSSNSALASVDAEGMVLGKSPVAVRITAGAGAVSGSAEVRVDELFSDLQADRIGMGGAWCFAPVGPARCMGDGQFGLLGDGSTSGVRTKPAPLLNFLKLTQVSVGLHHACGVGELDKAHCWGFNGHGNLGVGFESPEESAPIPVPGGHAFRTVAVGGHHSCGITTSHKLYCWGLNDRGQLGTGAPEVIRTTTLQPVLVSTSEKFTQLALGDAHTCAISTRQQCSAGVQMTRVNWAPETGWRLQSRSAWRPP